MDDDYIAFDRKEFLKDLNMFRKKYPHVEITYVVDTDKHVITTSSRKKAKDLADKFGTEIGAGILGGKIKKGKYKNYFSVDASIGCFLIYQGKIK